MKKEENIFKKQFWFVFKRVATEEKKQQEAWHKKKNGNIINKYIKNKKTTVLIQYFSGLLTLLPQIA